MIIEVDALTEYRELQHLGFTRFRPHPALSAWVQCYWVIAGTSLRASEEWLYPDGGVSLVFDLSGGNTENARLSIRHRLHKTRVQGEQFGIKFHPGGASRLLGLPMPELVGGVYACKALGLNAAAVLGQRLGELSSEARVVEVDVWLMRQIPSLDARVLRDQALINALTHPLLSVDQAVRSVGGYARQAERVLQRHVGCSPEVLNGWWRVRRARELIKTQLTRSLSDIGLECGYYDQAHFTKAFKKTTQMTPGQYRAKQKLRLSAGELQLF